MSKIHLFFSILAITMLMFLVDPGYSQSTHKKHKPKKGNTQISIMDSISKKDTVSRIASDSSKMMLVPIKQTLKDSVPIRDSIKKLEKRAKKGKSKKGTRPVKSPGQNTGDKNSGKKDSISKSSDSTKLLIQFKGKTENDSLAKKDTLKKTVKNWKNTKDKKGSKKKPSPTKSVSPKISPENPVSKDSSTIRKDSLIVKPGNQTKTDTARNEKKIDPNPKGKINRKKGVKKKLSPMEVKQDSIPKKDTIAEIKDTVKVTFGKNIVNLRTITGWIKDDRGKWVSSPNRIPFMNPDYNNEFYTKYEIGSENIRQINIEEIYIDSTPYLAVIIEQLIGHYRDKKDSDFHAFVGADYFLIHREDFAELWNDSMKIKTPYEVNLKAYYSGLVGYKNIKLRPQYMAKEINKDLRNKKFTDTAVKIYLQFGLRPFQNKSGKYMRFNYGLAYAKDGQPIPPFDFGALKNRFYETDLELFHKFARPKDLKKFKKVKSGPVIKKPVVQPPNPDGRPIED